MPSAIRFVRLGFFGAVIALAPACDAFKSAFSDDDGDESRVEGVEGYSCASDDYDCILRGLSFKEGGVTLTASSEEVKDESPTVSAYVTDDATYVVFDFAKTWSAARTHLQSLGGELAAFNSAPASEWYVSANTWIGLNDISAEGSFVWAGGSAVGYTDWANGTPANAEGLDCVFKDAAQSSQWVVGDCSSLYGAVGQWAEPPSGLNYDVIKGDITAPVTIACGPGKIMQVPASNSAAMCFDDCSAALAAACAGGTECTVDPSICPDHSCGETMSFEVSCNASTTVILGGAMGDPWPATYVDSAVLQQAAEADCAESPTVSSVSDYASEFACMPFEGNNNGGTNTGGCSCSISGAACTTHSDCGAGDPCACPTAAPNVSALSSSPGLLFTPLTEGVRQTDRGDMHIKWSDPGMSIPILCFAVCPSCTQDAASGRCLRPAKGPPQGCSKSLACLNGRPNGAPAGEHFVYFEYARFPHEKDMSYDLVVVPVQTGDANALQTGTLSCVGASGSVSHRLSRVQSMCLPPNERTDSTSGGTTDTGNTTGQCTETIQGNTCGACGKFYLCPVGTDDCKVTTDSGVSRACGGPCQSDACGDEVGALMSECGCR